MSARAAKAYLGLPFLGPTKEMDAFKPGLIICLGSFITPVLCGGASAEVAPGIVEAIAISVICVYLPVCEAKKVPMHIEVTPLPIFTTHSRHGIPNPNGAYCLPLKPINEIKIGVVDQGDFAFCQWYFNCHRSSPSRAAVAVPQKSWADWWHGDC